MTIKDLNKSNVLNYSKEKCLTPRRELKVTFLYKKKKKNYQK